MRFTKKQVKVERQRAARSAARTFRLSRLAVLVVGILIGLAIQYYFPQVLATIQTWFSR